MWIQINLKILMVVTMYKNNKGKFTTHDYDWD